MRIALKRAYDPPTPEDGRRILVDRLWPRGLSREVARIDLWLREIAPSNELRRWFGHAAEKWPAFFQRYVAELDALPEALARLRAEIAKGPVTLVFAAKDSERNNAVVLRDYLQGKRCEAGD